MKINKIEFKNARKFETTLAGRPLVIETGKLAQLANGSCLVRYGETIVLAAATASEKPRDGIDFFPLSVDFDEKLYAVGRIPGSFMRREARPSEPAVLASRAIDRPMRPLFPSDLRNDVSIVTTVMGLDEDCSPEITAMIGAAVAVAISDIPFANNMAGVSAGLVNGKIVINPNKAERAISDMDVTVAATKEKIVMIEAGANQVPEQTMYDALMLAHEEIKKIVEFIDGIQKEIGKPKFKYESHSLDKDVWDKLYEFSKGKIENCLDTDDKNIREERMFKLKEEFLAYMGSEALEGIDLGEYYYQLQKKVVRKWLIEGKRVDGREMDEVRGLGSEVSILPRAHGSALFTRGQTQVLTVATLGTMRDAQELDTIFDATEKRYMHHYNFPSYSVGETRPSRGPGRREIGHGALAERSLVPVLPSIEEFPYSIRLVSEVISSNGSTSQGSVCGSTLALMDAGVPIKAPVAGISCGLIVDGDTETVFTDIQGLEDFYGDMDFKVAGSKSGITSIQVDIKTDGLSPNVIKQALDKCASARYLILDEVMLKAIDKPRSELSDFAPKMIQIQIDPEKIRDIIGKGGAVIQKITADTNTKIDITDDGKICIAGIDKNDMQTAKDIILNIVKVPVAGEIYHAKVVRLMQFGAFMEILPGKDGMVHISKIDQKRIEKVEDVLSVGDMRYVKIMEIDDKGRINLSIKDVDQETGK